MDPASSWNMDLDPTIAAPLLPDGDELWAAAAAATAAALGHNSASPHPSASAVESAAPGSYGSAGGMHMPMVMRETSFGESPPQQLLAMPPMHPSTHSAHLHATHPALASGPPAHLFADSMSPFAQAVFEVEGDLNAVNPSSFISPPAVARGATGDSLHFAMAPAAGLSIGHMAPQPILGQYDSLIDAQEELLAANNNANANAGAPHSRKRARAAAPPVYANPETVAHPQLDDSTFRVFVPPTRIVPDESGELESPARSAHAMEHMRAAQAHSHSHSHSSARPPSSVSSVHSGGAGQSTSPHGGAAVVDDKKKKHQETDRERRRRIKDSMDELKKLVPLAPDQKADQATIVGASVTMIADLKDEVAELRKKLQQMEMSNAHEQQKLESKRASMQRASGVPGTTLLSNAPFTSMMASLNGAGVSMWRLSLTGKLLEVNVVWELVSGFSAAEVVGGSPCGPPLFGSLSIMPAAFLKAFAQVSATPKHNSLNGEALALQPRYGSSSGVHTPSSVGSDVHSPHTPGSHSGASSVSAATARGGSEDESTPTSPIGHGATSSSGPQNAVAPLYANASISNFPIVPQHQLQNFFPATVRCQSLIDAQEVSGVPQPQPHGTFLVNHLAALPPGHVLKLLARHQTLWGEILESIVTLCLVRDSNGQPDFVLVLSTPDTRRLLTPATHLHSRHSATLPQFDDQLQAIQPAGF